MIKILPVYPEFPLTFWSFKSSIEYIGKKSIMPPTGLATVLAMLPKEHFKIHRIIDMNVEPLTDEQIKNADLIFTSTMVVQEESHNKIIERVHKLGKKIVAGGPFPTSYPEKVNADYIVAGEAELTLAPFINDLLNGNPKRIYTEESVLHQTKRKKGEKPALTSTPIPRWDLINLNNYSSASIQFSRGCPFNCEFCDITSLFGRISRTKSPQQMIKELDALLKTGYTGYVFILDDNFIGNAPKVRELLPEMIRWQKKHKYAFRFFTEASMNLAWPEYKDILELMVKAGFDEVFLGIETPDADALKEMKKVQNTRINPLEAVKIIQKAGMEVTGGFIIGSDGDKESVFEDLFNFIQEAGIVVPMPGLLTAIKGTGLYNRLESEKRILSDPTGNNTHRLSFNFKTKLPEKLLIKGYANLLSKLFEPRNYYKRCRTLQNNLGNPRLPRKKIEKQELLAVYKLALRQLFAKDRLDSLRFLVWTSTHHPRLLPFAISHVIKLNHFKKLTRATLNVQAYEGKTKSLYKRFKHTVEKSYEKYLTRKNEYSTSEKIDKAETRAIRHASKIILKAEKKYLKLHKDFREDASPHLKNLKENINTELKRIMPDYPVNN